eukprot:8369549-Alexandrium_andersonii.AAC.1
MTAEFRPRMGLARLSLEDPYHAVMYRVQTAPHRVVDNRGGQPLQSGIPGYGRGVAGSECRGVPEGFPCAASASPSSGHSIET